MHYEFKFCDVCKIQTPHYDFKCGRCLEKKAKEAERMWEAQDIDTKLTNLRKRIEYLERGEPRY